MGSRKLWFVLVVIALLGAGWRFRDKLGLGDREPEKLVMVRVTGACSPGVLVTADNRNPTDVVRMTVRTTMVNAETASQSGDFTQREWTKRIPANGSATDCWTFHSRVRPGEEPVFELEAISVDLDQ
jgi:hypothetical protein